MYKLLVHAEWAVPFIITASCITFYRVVDSNMIASEQTAPSSVSAVAEGQPGGVLVFQAHLAAEALKIMPSQLPYSLILVPHNKSDLKLEVIQYCNFQDNPSVFTLSSPMSALVDPQSPP